jgi:NAD(P)-dependent dehydrogenase (short-subunit alcohol dehydrogenase family)
MYLDLHWYECRGSDLRDSVALVEGEGGNIGVATVTDYGPVYNKIIVVGKGTSWANAPVKTAVSVESISKNGLREYVAYYSDISDETTLQAIADALLAQLAFPRRRISIDQTLDRDPAPFSAYHVGDIVTLDCLHKAGDFAFKGPVRILARQWSPGDVVGLELEEWND